MCRFRGISWCNIARIRHRKKTRVGPRIVLDETAQWLHLQNTIEQSVHDGDAAWH